MFEKNKKILLIFGTRPEAIKMAPLVIELKKHKDFKTIVCVTGQHREMLDQVMDAFGIKADFDLDIMKEKQSLTSITTAVLTKLEPVLKAEKPDLVLVHGDTTTSVAAAMAAFYQQIPVGHVEAGLRTGNIYSPFPEEMNRIMIDRISSVYFAPTKLNEQNLKREGISKNIFVTGNTVIDAFAYTVKSSYRFHEDKLNGIDYEKRKVVIVTAHRRENLGKPLENICNAILRLSEKYKDLLFVYPVHLNPVVRNTVTEFLANKSNMLLLNPIDVLDMHNLMARCFIVMTDSGGIQEEAPHFGKPVLVLRTETERPEAVEAGTVKVVGIEEETIFADAENLIDNAETYNKMANAVNPYGDGHASERIVKLIEELVLWVN